MYLMWVTKIQGELMNIHVFSGVGADAAACSKDGDSKWIHAVSGIIRYSRERDSSVFCFFLEGQRHINELERGCLETEEVVDVF